MTCFVPCKPPSYIILRTPLSSVFVVFVETTDQDRTSTHLRESLPTYSWLLEAELTRKA